MKNKIIRTIKLLSCAIIFISCENGAELNMDPNSFYSTKPSALLTNAEKGIGDYLSTPNVNINNFRLTMQYWQETTYVDESNYDFVNRNISNNVWSNYYINVLQNLVQAKKIINEYQPTASETPTWPVTKKNQVAIIDILQVFVYSNLVDTYGDIPYTSSNDITNNQLPTYDKAADIYTSLIARLKTDINNLDTSGISFQDPSDLDKPCGEVFYNGNVTKWKIFANSLLLKLGITLSDVNPSLAQSIVNEAVSNGVMTSSADDCIMSYESSSPNYSQLFANVVASGRNDYVAGKTIIDYMNATSDIRRSTFFQSVGTTGQYIGATIGAPASFTSKSHVGEYAYTPTTPAIILNYTEVAFYLAEAAARWSPSNATSAYNKAISASFLQWGYTLTDAADYIAIKPYDTTNWKKSIGEQAWVALIDQGSTSWNTWRRLDYPILVAPSTAISQAEGKVPVRLQYPTSEATTNGTNFTNAGVAIGGDKLTTKVFWDKF